MKSIIYIILALFFIGITNNSCKPTTKQYKIGILQPSLNRARFVNDGKYIVSNLNKLGIETIMEYANDDNAKQIQQGMKMIEEGVNMLIIIPVNGTTIAPLVRKCKIKGVKVMAYNRLIRNVDYDIFLTGNNIEMAKSLTSIPLKEKPNGQYVILAGDRFDQNGYELKVALDSILEPLVSINQIKIIYKSYIEGWKQNNAIFELKEVLNSVDAQTIDAIISCNGSMAMASIEVLKEYGLEGKIIVVGQDADIPALKAIYDGNLMLTIYHPHKTLGKKTAEVCLELLNNNPGDEITPLRTPNGKSNIPTVRVKSIAVTKENINDLYKNGYFKEADIFN